MLVLAGGELSGNSWVAGNVVLQFKAQVTGLWLLSLVFFAFFFCHFGICTMQAPTDKVLAAMIVFQVIIVGLNVIVTALGSVDYKGESCFFPHEYAVLLAIFLIISNDSIDLSSAGVFMSDRPVFITPARWTFCIWSAIYIWLSAIAIYCNVLFA